MKMSVFVTMLIVVGVVLFAMTQMINEAENQYDITINQSSWVNESDTTATSKYDFAGRVNDSIWPIGQSIRTITDESSGWLDIIGAGFTGLIKAVTFLPDMLFTALVMGASLITGLGTSVGVPSYITFVFIIMLTVWGIFQLVEFFNRWPT